MITWTCHVCKQERPDSAISVHTTTVKDTPFASQNIRYCNDRKECIQAIADGFTLLPP